MLDEDVTNNSVWSYRFFIVNKTNKEFDKELVNREINYVIQKRLRDNLFNESAWVYLRGMLATNQEEATKSLTTNAKKCFILDFPQLKEECLKLLKEDDFNKGNRFIYTTLIDYYVADADFEKALEYLELLKEIDRIRI